MNLSAKKQKTLNSFVEMKLEHNGKNKRKKKKDKKEKREKTEKRKKKKKRIVILYKIRIYTRERIGQSSYFFL